MPMCNVLFHDALNLAIASGDTVKVAFYAAAASISATTAVYSGTNEVTQAGATPAINAQGLALSGRTITASDGSVATAKIDYDNVAVTPSSQFQFQKILVHNVTRNRALGYHDYGSVQTWNAGTPYTLNIADLFTLASV
jgi:hypothetical protein